MIGAVYRPAKFERAQEAAQEDQASFVLAGRYSRVLSGGQEVQEYFFQSCLATGRLAPRLGTLAQGTALCVSGEMVRRNDELHALVTDAAVLPDDPERLMIDSKDGLILCDADYHLRLRGIIASPPQQRQLLEGPSITNARLGLTLHPAQPNDKYHFIELAAYHDGAARLSALNQGNYVALRGLLQFRRSDAGEWFQRIEMTRLDVLHPKRALL